MLKKSQDSYARIPEAPGLFASSSVYKDRGFEGRLGLSYLSNGYESDESKSSENKFVQEYGLGYRGNIYNPKLLDYSLMGILRYEDVDTKFNDEASKIKVESQDYKVDFNFLRDSSMPFRIYAEKSDRPTSVVYEAGLIRSLNSSESKGISGSIDFNFFDYTYSATDMSTQYESFLNFEDRNTKTYSNSIRKQEENYNFQLDYSNIEDIVQRNYTNSTQTTINSTEDNINLMYRWKINDEFAFDTYSYHREKEFGGSEAYSSSTTYANANLRWDPKTKHSASVSLDGFNIEDSFNTTESMTLREAYAYKITKNLTLSQQADHSIVTSDILSTQSSSVGSAINYSESISKETRINSSLSANVRTFKSDNNVSANSNRYTYYARAGLSHDLSSLNSQANINVGYNESSSTLDEEDARYNADFTFTTMLYSLVRNHFNTSYYKEESKLRYLDVFMNRSINTILIEDYLSNSSQIGINGTLTTKVGASYSSVENGMTKLERLNPKGDLSFKYRFGSKVIFTSDMNVDSDLIYDIMTYRANNNLAYSTQKTKISLGYIYSKVIAGEDSALISRNSYALQARFERKF
ncbi:MAG: hypothetical protein PHU40_09850 [Sulfurimonas sp.]|nr:hypothetical protein [Sulfurimonas sp.]